ncbi:MAG: hypothetical protein HY060_16890, partial [Proteobacteria bacterium]|nr:hypothetical protein [Pseudomonadota bacterium]
MSALISLCQNAALLAIGILVYSFARASLDRWPTPIATLCSGAIFAVLTLLSMLAPLAVFPGFILDARNTLVALATVFAGPLAGVMAALPAVVHRLEIGGPGAPGAIYSLAVSMLLAWGLRHWAARRGVSIGIGHLASLGGAISLLLLPSLFLIDDPERRAAIFETAMLPFALSIVLGLCCFGMLIIMADRRRALQREIAQRDHTLRRSQAAMTRILQDELLTERSLAAQLRAITRQGADALAIDLVSVWQYDDAGLGSQCVERWDAGARAHQRVSDARFDEMPDIRQALSQKLVHRAIDARNDPIAGPYVAKIYPDAGPVSILYAAIRHA